MSRQCPGMEANRPLDERGFRRERGHCPVAGRPRGVVRPRRLDRGTPMMTPSSEGRNRHQASRPNRNYSPADQVLVTTMGGQIG